MAAKKTDADEFFDKVQDGFLNQVEVQTKKDLRLGVDDILDYAKYNKGHIHDIYYLFKSGKLTKKEMGFLRSAIKDESKIYAEQHKRVTPHVIEELLKGLFEVILKLVIVIE